MSWPLSPSNGQQTVVNGIVYVYDSVNQVWNRLYQTTVVGGGIVTAVTVTQASQPNITSVGVMSNMTSTGNIVGANLMGSHANGTSNVSIPIVNSNVTISVAGNANVVTVTGTGVNVAGTLNTGTGNANVGNLGVTTDANIGGNLVLGGSLTVSGSTTTVNSTVTRVVDPIIELGGGVNGAVLGVSDGKDRGQLLHYYSSGAVDAFMGYKPSTNEFILANSVSVTGEIVTVTTYGNLHVGNANLGNLVTANFFTGAGNLLSNIYGPNVSGWVPNANIANTITANAQPNITSVGTLTNVTIAGPNSITGANLVSANYFTGTITTPSQLNITTLGTLTGLSVNSSVNANSFTSNIATGTAPLSVISTTRVANLNVANAGFSDTAGTVTQAAQTTITSVGTLTGLTVTGAIVGTAGGVRVGNIQDPSGTNTITLLSGAVSLLGNLTIGTGGTGNFVSLNANLGNVARANYFTGTLTTAIQPNITSVGTLASLTVAATGNITSGNADLGNVATANYFTSNTGINANAITVSGLLTSAETSEVVVASGAASATTINYDFTAGGTFYHSSVTAGANWTANLQNVPTTDARSIVFTLIVVQGATPYIPSAVTIDGGATTLKWSGGSAPGGTVSGVDIFSFALIRSGAAWAQILGSYSSFA